ncbi:hypothetical protein CDAR_583761 [Caerostris darwini]|uniref:Uncharacterized protein n=1 Tax=Caerostris darwini TaxID=1538125 RepID=A0AAV4RDB7_9ARAC|nr:hypothetical protein CDAR_583761 [Caerostris darwini]
MVESIDLFVFRNRWAIQRFNGSLLYRQSQLFFKNGCLASGLATHRAHSSPNIWQPTFSLLDQKTHRFVATNIVYLIPLGVRYDQHLQSLCQIHVSSGIKLAYHRQWT